MSKIVSFLSKVAVAVAIGSAVFVTFGLPAPAQADGPNDFGSGFDFSDINPWQTDLPDVGTFNDSYPTFTPTDITPWQPGVDPQLGVAGLDQQPAAYEPPVNGNFQPAASPSPQPDRFGPEPNYSELDMKFNRLLMNRLGDVAVQANPGPFPGLRFGGVERFGDSLTVWNDGSYQQKIFGRIESENLNTINKEFIYHDLIQTQNDYSAQQVERRRSVEEVTTGLNPIDHLMELRHFGRLGIGFDTNTTIHTNETTSVQQTSGIP